MRTNTNLCSCCTIDDADAKLRSVRRNVRKEPEIVTATVRKRFELCKVMRDVAQL
jgi:hypothetical protein